MTRTVWLMLAAVLALAGCRVEVASGPYTGGGVPVGKPSGGKPGGGVPTDTTVPDDPVVPGRIRVLFIGNSLTYFNDLPGMVLAMAESAQVESVVVEMAALPNYSLEDHWTSGPALNALRNRGGWSFVVMQQGPSGLPESRVNLLEWAGRWDAEIRAAGAMPVMYMVWPDQSRMTAFDSVSASYRDAATAIHSLLAPAGDAWIEIWKSDPQAPLYSEDLFHPSADGSYVAALTISSLLFARPATDFPAALRTTSGVGVSVSAARAAEWQAAVERALH